MTLEVAMTEYEFRYADPVAHGRIVVKAANKGQLVHQLVVVQVPVDFPPIDAQLHAKVQRGLATIATLPARPPGQDGTFAMDLPPGRYAMICFVKDVDGVQHSLKGMSSEFRVI